jgi:hypothetical protein
VLFSGPPDEESSKLHRGRLSLSGLYSSTRHGFERGGLLFASGLCRLAQRQQQVVDASTLALASAYGKRAQMQSGRGESAKGRCGVQSHGPAAAAVRFHKKPS